MIECINLTKKFGSGEGSIIALNDISFSIERGEFVAIRGKSGCGKSTLLNIIGLIDRPDTGGIVIDGKNIQECSDRECSCFRNKKMGYVFQAFYLESGYSVEKNVEIPLVIDGVAKKKRKELVEDALKMVGLENRKKTRTGSLSGGEQQRVSIARAIVNHPDILLADEPCGNLDSENTDKILNIFCKLHEAGKTIVMVTHSDEDALRADRSIHMKDGRIVD